MSFWEELESARSGLLGSNQSRVRAWLEEVLPGLVQRFQKKVEAALEAFLKSEMDQPSAQDLDSFSEHLRKRVHQTLATCQAEAMRALRTAVEGLARDFGTEAGAALVTQWRRSPGAGTGRDDLPSLVAAALTSGGMRWEPPALGQPGPLVWDLDLPPSFLGLILPDRWARRRVVTLVRASLPAAIRAASEQVDQIALGYWDRCLASLDGALELQVQQIRSNMERGGLPGCLDEPLAATGFECVVCTQVWRALYAFFTQFQQALATEPEVQGAFRTDNGLCPSHLWLLERFSSPRGLCAGLSGLVESLADRLAGMARGGAGSEPLDLLPHLASPDRCAACQTLEQATRDAVDQIKVVLREPAEILPDLCLQHLPLVLAYVDRGRGAELANRLALRLAQVARAMAGLGLKFDARRRDLLTEAERRADREALAWLAGNRNLLGHPGGKP